MPISDIWNMDPVTYRYKQQKEDYAWKIELLTADFLTRAEAETMLIKLIQILRTHGHGVAGNYTTGTSLTGADGLRATDLGIQSSVIAKTKPWMAAGGIEMVKNLESVLEG